MAMNRVQYQAGLPMRHLGVSYRLPGCSSTS